MTCKHDSSMLQVGQVRSGFVCHTKNRFAPLSPSIEIEGQNNTECSIVRHNSLNLSNTTDKRQTQPVKVSKLNNDALTSQSRQNIVKIGQNNDNNIEKQIL